MNFSLPISTLARWMGIIGGVYVIIRISSIFRDWIREEVSVDVDYLRYYDEEESKGERPSGVLKTKISNHQNHEIMINGIFIAEFNGISVTHLGSIESFEVEGEKFERKRIDFRIPEDHLREKNNIKLKIQVIDHKGYRILEKELKSVQLEK